MSKEINNNLIADILDQLHFSPVLVKFNTKTGKVRVMRCTRNLDLVPERLHDGINDFRLNGDSIIAVYDLQNSAWRSFRKDSVISYEVDYYD